jgi:dihydrodipicolinate synthase/N-acetylneuraminate lyase
VDQPNRVNSEKEFATMPTMRGVFVILPTPFDESLRLDFAGLQRVVEFCIDCGVQGVVTTANASEAGYLSDGERRQVVETALAAAKGKVTTVVGVSSSCWPIACELARHAEAHGADALMAMPPTFHRPSESEIRAFYGAIDQASSLPMFLQNYGGVGGTSMSARLMVDLVRSVRSVAYVKEETEFSSVLLTETLDAATSDLKGIMGGKAGRQLLDEHRRGACGTMPACEASDVHVALWDALEAGEQSRANDIFRLLLPLLNFEVGYGPAVYKEVLRRRGVIKSSALRQTGGRVLDQMAHTELDAILSAIAPLCRGWLPHS